MLRILVGAKERCVKENVGKRGNSGPSGVGARGAVISVWDGLMLTRKSGEEEP